MLNTKEVIEAIGIDGILSLTAEENSELAYTCMKTQRAAGIGLHTERSKETVKSMLIEEIADVSICLSLLTEALGLEEAVQNLTNTHGQARGVV